ncbi:hypothetical protein Q3G72_022694 [Acer saccharum]|nr:hypothetical protein Q3G72_019595 [Acer saccharum]KAK1583313.1 hypothetical protein Q3G72_022694 [Acer saccharum]
MERKACLRLMLLFLGFSYLLSSTATRNLKSNNEIPSSVQEILAQDAILEVSETEELFGMSENDFERRMDLENTDYPGTGANNHHDPKTPGRS